MCSIAVIVNDYIPPFTFFLYDIFEGTRFICSFTMFVGQSNSITRRPARTNHDKHPLPEVSKEITNATVYILRHLVCLRKWYIEGYILTSDPRMWRNTNNFHSSPTFFYWKCETSKGEPQKKKDNCSLYMCDCQTLAVFSMYFVFFVILLFINILQLSSSSFCSYHSHCFLHPMIVQTSLKK